MKKFFTRGLIALLPLILTIVILYLAAGFLYKNVGTPIGEGLKWIAQKGFGLSPAGPLPDGTPAPSGPWSWFFSWGAPVAGFCVAALLTILIGFVAATLVGNRVYRYFESLLSRLPIVKTVYPYARQFTDFLFSESARKPENFRFVVAVPFPARGLYAIGFLTGEGLRILNEVSGRSLVSVFVPTSPAPFGGFVLYVPREEVVPMPLSIEEAMRILISAGVIHPDHQRVPPNATFVRPLPPAPPPVEAPRTDQRPALNPPPPEPPSA